MLLKCPSFLLVAIGQYHLATAQEEHYNGKIDWTGYPEDEMCGSVLDFLENQYGYFSNIHDTIGYPLHNYKLKYRYQNEKKGGGKTAQIYCDKLKRYMYTDPETGEIENVKADNIDFEARNNWKYIVSTERRNSFYKCDVQTNTWVLYKGDFLFPDCPNANDWDKEFPNNAMNLIIPLTVYHETDALYPDFQEAYQNVLSSLQSFDHLKHYIILLNGDDDYGTFTAPPDFFYNTIIAEFRNYPNAFLYGNIHTNNGEMYEHNHPHSYGMLLEHVNRYIYDWALDGVFFAAIGDSQGSESYYWYRDLAEQAKEEKKKRDKHGDKQNPNKNSRTVIFGEVSLGQIAGFDTTDKYAELYNLCDICMVGYHPAGPEYTNEDIDRPNEWDRAGFTRDRYAITVTHVYEEDPEEEVRAKVQEILNQVWTEGFIGNVFISNAFTMFNFPSTFIYSLMAQETNNFEPIKLSGPNQPCANDLDCADPYECIQLPNSGNGRVAPQELGTCNLKSKFSVTVPLYVYPWEVWGGPVAPAWANVAQTVLDYPNIDHYIIINPDSGQGASTEPNDAWKEALALFTPFKNAFLVGYVPLNFGEFSTKKVLNLVKGYFKKWALDGIYFDEVGNILGETSMERLRIVAAYAKNTNAGRKRVKYNKARGIPREYNKVLFNMKSKLQSMENPDPQNINHEWPREIYDMCDICGTSEQVYSPDWNVNIVSAYGQHYSREKFSILLRNVVAGEFEHIIGESWQKYFGNIFLTTADEYHNGFIDGSWQNFVNYLDMFNHDPFTNPWAYEMLQPGTYCYPDRDGFFGATIAQDACPESCFMDPNEPDAVAGMCL